MKKYLRLFKNHDDYLDFKKTNDFKLPNVSHCEQENGVHYNPYISTYNGHAYVDLGLPSGTKWAKMNVGASSEKDKGLYFAWGETQESQEGGHKVFMWRDYRWTKDGGSTFTKYNTTDNKTHLEPTDDAAAVNMGGDWHMPNRTQCIELFIKTNNGIVTDAGAFTQYDWDNSNGYSSPTSTTATISGWNTLGYFFFKKSYTSVTDAISHKDYLFIPSAGYYVNGAVVGVSHDGAGYDGGVWASALGSKGVQYAWDLCFGISRAGVGYDSRYYGLPVRGVVGQMDEAILPYNSIQGGEVTPSNPEVGELS